MDSKRIFEKFLEEKGGDKKMERFDESNLTLRSIVMFKKKYYIYLFKEAQGLILYRLDKLLILFIGKLELKAI